MVTTKTTALYSKSQDEFMQARVMASKAVHKCADCEKVMTHRNRRCDDCYKNNRQFSSMRDADMSAKAGLIISQGGRCAGCSISFGAISARRVHLDHSHKTGAVRGVLCASCNRVLGMVADKPSTLRALADYLDKAP